MILMRILLSKDSRKIVFDFLKKKHNSKNLIELSKNMNVPFKTLKKWRYAELYMPSKLLPKKLRKLKIIDKKEENWGAKIGGKIGGIKRVKILKEELGEKKYSKLMSKMGKKGGKKAIKLIQNRYGKELTKKIIEGKIKKRELESKELELKNNSFFTNKNVTFNPNQIFPSKIDGINKINLPQKMSKELAEEIGVHLGDGCLRKTRNYFSVRCDRKEEEYVKNHLIPLYKKLYNIEPRLIFPKNLSGFEIHSKSLFEFKHNILKIPYGPKIERITVPRTILESKNKEIYRSFIRGLFDTDGCIYIARGNYPRISITIKSKIFMKQIYNMLKKLGFLPSIHKWTVTLHGPTMLKKWINEINSNNPKHQARLQRANSIVDSTWPCGLK